MFTTDRSREHEATTLAGSDVEGAVMRRYSSAAAAREEDLCCASTELDPSLLAALPSEIVERDYGCGDPTRFATKGEVVVDLGSGSGKACYMLSQRVGPRGAVIGVDLNEAMLSLARKHQAEIARRIGWSNVRFVKARIQDLRLDFERLETWLAANPVRNLDGWNALERETERLRREEMAIPDGHADLVVSNCVLNLVRPDDKRVLFAEIHRVLRRGGRAVISDIVCDEDHTEAIVADPDLWSGCIAGAFREDAFLEAFERTGFYGVEILEHQERPWRVVDGIEFRSVTVRALKGKEGPCLERNQAVVYRGPWKSVQDDDGHGFPRGKRVAVCDKTYRILTDPASPYSSSIVPVPPREEIPLEIAAPFACKGVTIRGPRSTKGCEYRAMELQEGAACTGPECC